MPIGRCRWRESPGSSASSVGRPNALCPARPHALGRRRPGRPTRRCAGRSVHGLLYGSTRSLRRIFIPRCRFRDLSGASTLSLDSLSGASYSLGGASVEPLAAPCSRGKISFNLGGALCSLCGASESINGAACSLNGAACSRIQPRWALVEASLEPSGATVRPRHGLGEPRRVSKCLNRAAVEPHTAVV